VNNSNLHPISHGFQFFFLPLTGVPLLTHSFAVNLKLTTTKFGLKKLETQLYRMVQKYI